ncbi:MAG: hypothetical protein LBI57_07240 [Helicobacteraceae bacterium]|jgi:hypothetical protein|nr:hypothetical protein [Helicobacteraceae bacterium]
MLHDSSINNGAAINSAIGGSGANISRVVGYNSSATISNNFALETMRVNRDPYDGATNDLNGTSESIGVDGFTAPTTLYDGAINGDGLGGLVRQFGENDDHPWKIDSNKNDGCPYLYWRE